MSLAARNSNGVIRSEERSDKHQLSLEKHGPFSVSASMCTFFFSLHHGKNKLGDGNRVVLGDSHSIRLRPRRDTDTRGSLCLSSPPIFLLFPSPSKYSH
ncbi:hypothetical protein CGRA01v4_05026 [Colletotrichum graminicola]|nr:hypothetical protein CGRA01v4_05026 [Colletotrichum graminicola]